MWGAAPRKGHILILLGVAAAIVFGCTRVAAAEDAPADTQAPIAPTQLLVKAAATTATSVTITWVESTDNVGVVAYGLYVNGIKVGNRDATNRDATKFTFGRLECGKTYTFALDAVDAAGNRSPKSQPLIASTSACSETAGSQAPTASAQPPADTTQPPTTSAQAPTASAQPTTTANAQAPTASAQSPTADGRPADGQAPTVPTGLASTGSTVSSISVSWTASTDNVGVAGYGEYLNGTLVTTSTGTSYTFTGLPCGTSYTLAVDAVDAAGNRSATAQLTATTKACVTPSPFLLGTQTLGPMSDYNPAGVAQAFSATATASGTIGGMRVYVDTQSTATSLFVGLYANASGRPGTLLGQGSTTSLKPGAWNDIRLPNINVSAGSVYWIAVLAPSGILYYRNYCCSGATSYASSSGGLTSLAGAWSGNTVYDAGPVAAYSFAPLAPDTSAPSAPTSLTTAGSTQTSVSLAWAAATDNVGVTGYGTYVNGALAGTSTATNYTVTGLTCGTTYTFAVDATDAAGNRSGKTQISTSTSACSAPAPPPPPSTDTQAPTSPTGLTASGATATAISVSWTASTDNVGVTGYGKYQNGALLTTSAGTTYAFSGLSCGTTYTLAVDAVDAAGNRSGKAQTTASTAPCGDNVAPSAPTGLASTGATASSISVSWTASTDNVGVTGYGKYQNGTFLTTSPGTTYTFSGLFCGTTYTLAVDAVDAAGNRSGKAQITASTAACTDIQPPSAPIGLASTGATASSISVSWTPSTDNVGVAGYGKYLNGALVATSTGTSYTFTGLPCGTTYTLAVDAVDAAGNRSGKTQISAATGACATAPFVLGTQTLGPMSDYNPAGWAQAFSMTASASGTVGGLHVWVDLQSTASSLVVGLYSNASGQPGTLLGQGSANGLTPGSWNDVRLPNVNVTGGSMYWIALLAPSGTLYYRDACCSGSTSYVSSSTSLTSMPSSWSGTSVYDAGPVAAYSFGPLAPDTSAPTAPSALTTSGTTQTSVSLSWAAATDNVGVTGYNTYVNGTLAGSSTATSYAVTGLTCGTTYMFSVEARDAAGNRSPQASVTASTASCSSPAPPPPSPPPSGSPSVYVATTGSDSNTCTSTAPCKTFDRAYHVASAGQVVQVAGGSYPDQTLGADSSKRGPGVVTFQPAAGAAVTVADIYVEGASYVTFTNMTVGFRFHVQNDDPSAIGSTNVTFNSMKAQTFDVVGRVANVTVHGGSFGNTVNHQPQISKFNQSDSNTAQPQNVVIEDSVFQNFRASDPSVHTECLQVLNANGLTIQRNKFSTCDSTGDLGLTCEPGTTNITVENNWLMGGGSPGYGAQISGDCNNLKFRYNSSVLDVFFADSVNSPPYSFVGNYISFNSWLCRSSGVTYSHNVTDGGTCGSTDVSVPSLDFVGSLDLHLKAGANAINKGDPASYPSTDIDGVARPKGSAPDAGAVEAG